MAPSPLFFNIHTDHWGNHRTGNPSISKTVGGVFTDLWGSHRGGPTPATTTTTTTGEVVMRRSIKCAEGVYWSLVENFTMVPTGTWWSALLVFDLVAVLLVVVFFLYPQAGCAQIRRDKAERLVVVEAVEMESEDEKDMWV